MPTTSPTATATASPVHCTGTNLTGTWVLTADSRVNIFQNGIATLQQNGTTITGTLVQPSGLPTYTISGTVQGSTVDLTFTAPLQVGQSFTFTLSPDGSTMTGNPGVFNRTGC
jgi:hypothetical protein